MRLRAIRLGEFIKKELSELFQKEIKDPRLNFLTIMDVKVSGDLQVAKIYVSTLEGQNTPDQLMEGLEQATGFLRKELSKKLNTRYTPELRFIYDTSVERSNRIFSLLKKIKADKDG